MPRRQITFQSGEYYHVYNRGHSRQVIFRDHRERYREFVERSAAYPPGIGPYLIDDV